MAFTYFFRDLHILDLAVNHVVPVIAGRRNIRFWDAGCAMGPEAYTLAILCAEKMGYFAFKNLKIHATDIDTSNLFADQITSGLYKRALLERIPKELFDKYFEPAQVSDHYQVIETVRNRISFERHNLLTLEPVGDNFSLIICKNVLLHFNESERIKVIEMFHRSLAVEGFFATEQTQKLPKETAHLFRQVSSDGQLFRKEELVNSSRSS
jgi:chemotaxis protein methyltransferase CheR